MGHFRKQTRWTLGTHSFSAREVCTWGKYNKNEWQGPVKAALEPRFRTWTDNLYRGIVADNKRSDRISLVAGHYQDAYLVAERGYAETAPDISNSDSMDALVQQVLQAETPYDILSVPEGGSMRTLHRRWAGLTK